MEIDRLQKLNEQKEHEIQSLRDQLRVCLDRMEELSKEVLTLKKQLVTSETLSSSDESTFVGTSTSSIGSKQHHE